MKNYFDPDSLPELSDSEDEDEERDREEETDEEEEEFFGRVPLNEVYSIFILFAKIVDF